MNEINGLSRIALKHNVLSDPVKNKDLSFSDRLKDALAEVNTKHHEADQAIESVMQDKMDVQEGMMAIQEADVSLRLLIQVRAKVMAAYNEIMHMQF